jgi:chromosome segregation ATPase
MFNFNTNYFSHKDINKNTIDNKNNLDNSIINIDDTFIKLINDSNEHTDELCSNNLLLKNKLIDELKEEIENQKSEQVKLKEEIENQKSEQVKLKEEISILKEDLTKTNKKNQDFSKQIMKINEKILGLELKSNNSNNILKNLTQEQMDDLKRQEYIEKYNLIRRKTLFPFTPLLSNDLLFTNKFNEFKKK